MTKTSNEVINSLREHVSTRFAGPRFRAAANRIGLLLASNMKVANRRVLRVRTGRLINSLQYRIRDIGDGGVEIEAGSFGVPYAAIHEFGYSGVVNIRSHSRRGRKGASHNVRGHTAQRSIPARPYVGPGFDRSKDRIIDIMRELAK